MSAFDPSILMNFFQKNGGGNSPDTSPSTPPAPPAAAPGNGVSDAGQGSQRIVGIKNYLGNILYGVGEQVKSTVGLPTEDEQRQIDSSNAAAQQKLAQGAQQTQDAIASHALAVKQMQSPVTIPHPETGQPVPVPFVLAKSYIAQQAQSSGKPFMVVPNVGLWDTQAGKLTPDDIQSGITVTQPIAQHFGLPLQSVGQKVPLGKLAQLEQQQNAQVPPLNVPGADNGVSSLSDLARPSGGQVPQSLQLLQSIKAQGGTLPPNLQAALDNASAPPIGSVPGAQPNNVQNIPSSLIQPQGGQIPQSAANNAAAAGPIRLAVVNGQQTLVRADGQPITQQAHQPGVLRRVLTGAAQGFSRGVEASIGIASPEQRALMQAQTADTVAQTNLRNIQAAQQGQNVYLTNPVTGVSGWFPHDVALKMIAPTLNAQAGIKKTGMQTDSRESIAADQIASREKIATEKLAVESGKVGSYKPGVNPESGQAEYMKLDKKGNFMGWVPNSVVEGLVPKTVNSIQWQQGSDGTFTALPKTTTTTPNLPQASSPAAMTPQQNLKNILSKAKPQSQGQPQSAAQPGQATQAQPKPAFQGANANKPVIGVDAQGNQVFTSAGSASQFGLTQVRNAGAAEAEKVTNARNLIPLFDANGDASQPDKMGILQLVDALDKSGKLGPLASRWNEFLTGTWGAGDPYVEALRTKMGLSTTGLMQVHVGARGSSQLLEHFQDLVNQKKMDANTLRSGVKSEVDYIRDKAMLPRSQQSGNPVNTNNPYGFVPAH